MIRTMVADDHPIVRAGLRQILSECEDIEFAGEANDGIELLGALRRENYDLVLLDMQMPGKNGVELIRQIKDSWPSLPVLVLSTHKEDMYAVRTIRAGASGYLCKDNASSCLIQAIRKIASGSRYISPAVAEQLASEFHPANREVKPHSLLSNREYQVFLLIVNGKSVTEIAEQLNLSVKTISTHKVRIKDKLGLASVPEWVRYAINQGLIQALQD